jgi:PAS domain S-box-containing protein
MVPGHLPLSRLTIAFGVLGITAAVIGILSAHFSITLIGGVNPDNRTIALSAALIWIFLGSVLVYQMVKPLQRSAARVVQGALILIAASEAIEFVLSVQGSHFFIENLFVGAGTTIIGPSSSPISPVAAGLAVPSALALVLIIRRHSSPMKLPPIPDVISISGLLVSLVSFTVVLSYIYGDPLLYGTRYIPIAFISAVAAFFIGGAIITAAGPGAVPVRYIIGRSTSAGLLRVFIPLVIGIVIFENFVIVGLFSWLTFPDAVQLSSTLVIFTLATAFVVTLVSGEMGRALDRAEQELVRKNDDLGVANEELTAIDEELRQNIDDLTRAEERYRTLFDTMIEGFCIIEVVFDDSDRPLDYRFLEVNPAFEKQTGLHNAKGRLMRDLAPDHEDHWFEIYGNIALTGTPARFTNEARALGRWYDVSAYRLGGPESRKVAIFFNDITRRKKSEAALLESEQQAWARREELALLMNAVPAAVWIAHDPLALHITGNALSDEWLRLPHGAETSKSAPNEVRPETFRVFKDGRELQPSEMPVQMSAGGTVIRNFEFDLVYPDGTVRNVLGNSSPLHDEQGSLRGSVSSFIDITERRKTEEELKRRHDDLNALNEELSATQDILQRNVNNLAQSEMALKSANESLERRVAERTMQLENAVNDAGIERQRLYDVLETLPVYVSLLDADYRMPFANKYFRETFVEPQGRRCYDFLFNRTEPCETCETYTVMKTKAPHHWYWTGPNGRDYDIYDFPFTHSDGSLQILEMGIDITERNKAESALREAHDLLEVQVQERTGELLQKNVKLNEALAEKEILLSEIHHRVKNNLTAFISLLSLDGSYDTSPAGESLRKDLQNRARSMALIHETLYRTGKFSSVDMELYLTTLVGQIAGSYAARAEIEIVVEAQGVALDLARATTAGLIINELVTNSFKYAFPKAFDCLAVRGEPCTIRVSLASEDGTYLLTIADNGCGLPPDLDPLKTKSLGLRLVTFLSRHQLHAEIEIRTDKGTEFMFRLNQMEEYQ